MKLSVSERLVLEHLSNGKDLEVIPEDIRSKFTPEMLQLTLVELQAKGLVEYVGGAYITTKKAEELFKKRKVIKDEIIAWGHPKITGRSETRIEITKGNEPVNEKDAIIGVKANKSCEDLSEKLKNYLKFGGELKMTIAVGDIEDIVIAHGSPALKFIDEKNISIQKTDFINERTLAILADKSACDLKEELVKKLKSSSTKVKIVLEIK
jgi:hypothetical protein